MTMNGEQARMARAAVKLTVLEVAKRAKVSPNTVTRIEAGLPVHNSTIQAIRRVYEAAGVEFTNGGQPGVSLRRAGPTSIAAEDLNASNDE
jgi:transcriptional regulator with XRE-family HTH domain